MNWVHVSESEDLKNMELSAAMGIVNGNDDYFREKQKTPVFAGIVGQSSCLRQVLKHAEKVAPSDLLDRFASIVGFCDENHVVLGRENSCDSFPEHRMVINRKDPNLLIGVSSSIPV